MSNQSVSDSGRVCPPSRNQKAKMITVEGASSPNSVSKCHNFAAPLQPTDAPEPVVELTVLNPAYNRFIR
jgi:hypothetical protein